MIAEPEKEEPKILDAKIAEEIPEDKILTPKKPYKIDDLFKETEKEMEDMMEDMRRKIR